MREKRSVLVLLAGAVVTTLIWLNSVSRKMEPLKGMARKLDWQRAMGSWYVIGVIPTPFDRNCYQAKETYTQVGDSKNIHVKFEYKIGSFDAPQKTMHQEGVVGGEYSTDWKVRPTFLRGLIKPPFWLPFLVLDADVEDYQYIVVGYPDRKYLWIMSRDTHLTKYDEIVQRAAKEWQYDISKIWKVPHKL